MRLFLLLLLLLHGSIHLMGFAKAFGYAELKQLALPLSRSAGMAWLGAALLFMTAAILYLLKKEGWWWIAAAAVLVSQWLIIGSWKDARWGTIANIIILLVCVGAWGTYRFEQSYRLDYAKQLQRQEGFTDLILTEADLGNLPAPVQRYIRFSGALGRPRVRNMRVVFEGQMREKGKDFFPFVAEQYNFFDEPARLFFMKAKMMRLQVPGYHHYENRKASMDIRLFGLIPVTQQSGPAMDTTETVTLFNDMCLLAPATLIDPRISWEAVDDSTAIARFTNGNISISAHLYFHADGSLKDFRSEDRMAVKEGKKFPFTTPVHRYMALPDGRKVIAEGDAVWHYPEGAFTYGRFRLKEIRYNLSP